MNQIEASMTLRDQFAAAALTGLLAAKDGTRMSFADMATIAFIYADRMMVETIRPAEPRQMRAADAGVSAHVGGTED